MPSSGIWEEKFECCLFERKVVVDSNNSPFQQITKFLYPDISRVTEVLHGDSGFPYIINTNQGFFSRVGGVTSFMKNIAEAQARHQRLLLRCLKFKHYCKV